MEHNHKFQYDERVIGARLKGNNGYDFGICIDIETFVDGYGHTICNAVMESGRKVNMNLLNLPKDEKKVRKVRELKPETQIRRFNKRNEKKKFTGITFSESDIPPVNHFAPVMGTTYPSKKVVKPAVKNVMSLSAIIAAKKEG